MVGVIVGSKKTGINPDNVATPIAASFGDLITLAILAWISQGLYNCLGERRRVWTGYFQMEIRHKTSQQFFYPFILSSQSFTSSFLCLSFVSS